MYIYIYHIHIWIAYRPHGCSPMAALGAPLVLQFFLRFCCQCIGLKVWEPWNDILRIELWWIWWDIDTIIARHIWHMLRYIMVYMVDQDIRLDTLGCNNYHNAKKNVIYSWNIWWIYSIHMYGTCFANCGGVSCNTVSTIYQYYKSKAYQTPTGCRQGSIYIILLRTARNGI